MDKFVMHNRKNKLPKKLILRGYGAYGNALKNSIPIASGNLKSFVTSVSNTNADLVCPLSDNYRVGFIISSKRIKSAVKRNRLRRLLKESFRLLKYDNLEERNTNKFILIFTYTERGFSRFCEGKLTYKDVEGDMNRLLQTISNHIKKS